jgi:O-succinylbenzoic acid--CoA ligase
MDQPLSVAPLHFCPVAWQAQLNPHLIALQLNDQQISFNELHQRVDDLGQQLVTLSMKKGDRLACIAPNGLSLILLLFACLRHGFIFCPINEKFNQEEIQQRLTLLNTSFIWQENTANSIALNFKKTIPKSAPVHPIQLDASAVISIIFTSGSSGFPKAVMHNFSNHCYSALGSQSVIPLNCGDHNLLSLPLFHISGYATVMRTLLAGATIQLLNTKISTEQLLKAKITHLSLVSSQLITLLEDANFQAKSLVIKHLLLGGSAFPSALLEQIKARGFTYHLSYGSTEMASQIATSTNDEILKLLPHRKIKIVDKEILLSGKTRFVGYFSNKKMPENSYFSSSDLGELSGNTVKVIGRKDRQFISGGENIQPEEIEKILLSFSGLSQAYVLPINDSLYGQRPIAFIKWDKSVQSTQLKVFMKDKLIAFKRPLHYLTFPVQLGIKPNKKLLTDIALKLLFVN